MCCLCVKSVRTSVCTCVYVYARACVYAYMCVFCGMCVHDSKSICVSVFK